MTPPSAGLDVSQRWLVGILVLSALGLALLSYCLAPKSLLPDLALNLSGVAVGLVAVVLVYDRYQHRRRLWIWRTIRKSAVTALASRVCFMVQGFHWRICEPGYNSWGEFVRECDVAQSAASLALVTAKVAAIKENVALAGGNYHARVIPAPGRPPQDSQFLVKVLEDVCTDDAIRALRDLAQPLHLVGEDIVPLISSVEAFANAHWSVWQSGRAAHAGEGQFKEFMMGFPALLDRLLAIYSSCVEDLAHDPKGNEHGT